jgi:hypothetical protein
MPEGWDDTVRGDGPVDFEIGMRWTELWRLAWQPWISAAFLRMLADEGPDRSRIWVAPQGPVVRQRWPSRDALHGWHRDPGHAHRGPAVRFAREHGGTASWGLWHRVRDAAR